MKTIILDFDHTLFDTNKFKEALAASLENLGISKEEWHRTYAEITQSGSPTTYNYDREAQLKLLQKKFNFDLVQGRQKFQGVMNEARKFFFPNARWFLDKIKAKKWPMILLTWGKADFQQEKITKTGIKKYFSKIITVENGKKNILRQIVDDPLNTFYINDNCREIKEFLEQFPAAKCIAKKHPDHKIICKVDRHDVPNLTDFQEILSYIEKNS